MEQRGAVGWRGGADGGEATGECKLASSSFSHICPFHISQQLAILGNRETCVSVHYVLNYFLALSRKGLLPAKETTT